MPRYFGVYFSCGPTQNLVHTALAILASRIIKSCNLTLKIIFLNGFPHGQVHCCVGLDSLPHLPHLIFGIITAPLNRELRFLKFPRQNPFFQKTVNCSGLSLNRQVTARRHEPLAEQYLIRPFETLPLCSKSASLRAIWYLSISDFSANSFEV